MPTTRMESPTSENSDRNRKKSRLFRTFKRIGTIDGLQELNNKLGNLLKSLIDRTEDKQPVMTPEMIKQLYTARCLDLKIPIKQA